MKQKGLRYIFASAVITTALSRLIGGFATLSVKNSQIQVIDSQLNTIADSVRNNSSAPVSAALDSAAEQDFNVTIALVSTSGEITIINESLQYTVLLASSQVQLMLLCFRNVDFNVCVLRYTNVLRRKDGTKGIFRFFSG